jgi:hypothetical protein
MKTQAHHSGRVSTTGCLPVRHYFRSSLLALLLLAGAALLAGCGGGDNDLGMLGATVLQRAGTDAGEPRPDGPDR